MKILSLSSSVACGHVGNSATSFPLQRLGFAVTAINSVQFSNHPGHGSFGGDVFPPAHVAAVIDGLDRAGFLAGHDGVLSGYLGDAGNGPALLRAIAANPGACYVCDPVMGDDGRSYVRPGIAEFLAGPALAAAHMVTPNLYELGILSGAPVTGFDQAMTAARSLLAKGPDIVVVTSLEQDGAPACAAITASGGWSVHTPRLDFPHPVHGGGDLLAALLLAEKLNGADVPSMLAGAVSRLFTVLERSLALGSAELSLVAAQDALLSPLRRFRACQH